MTPVMTLFSTTKPFTNPHIAMIQRNAIRSWQQLGQEVQVVLIGNETGMAEAAAELDVLHLPQVACNSLGTPLLSSIFELAREVNDSPLLAYTNADMIYTPAFLETARRVMSKSPRFLIVSRRWDLDVTEPIDFSPGWVERMEERLNRYGKSHSPVGSDYFIFPRGCYTDFPRFIAGRSAWDNWMMYEARRQGWHAVDASDTLRVIHQNHDYSHLPNNQPPYRLPETAENIRLAGGDAAIFFLRDCNYRVSKGRLQPARLTWERFWREVEIFPLIRLRSRVIGYLFYYLRHPVKGYRVLRHWAAVNVLRRNQVSKKG
jgi:hypothetical protein